MALEGLEKIKEVQVLHLPKMTEALFAMRLHAIHYQVTDVRIISHLFSDTCLSKVRIRIIHKWYFFLHCLFYVLGKEIFR